MRKLFIKQTVFLGLALTLFSALSFGQTAKITTLCNTGLTPKNRQPVGCTTSSLVYPINPYNGGPITDGNWSLARPYPTAPDSQPAPNPCVLASAYPPSPLNRPSGAWVPDSDGLSQWIEPLGGDSTLAGWYIYRTQFFVPKAFPGISAYLLSVSGQYLVDDTVAAVYLEDPAGDSGSCRLVETLNGLGGFSYWTPFLFSAAVVPNTLANLYFVVENYEEPYGNPTGLRVEFSNAVIRP